MPFSFSGETLTHGIPKLKARYGLLSVAGLLFCLSGCVTRGRYLEDVDAAFVKGRVSAEVTYDQVSALEKDWDQAYRENAMRDKATIENLKRVLAAERRNGRFTKVNGVTVDREGK